MKKPKPLGFSIGLGLLILAILYVIGRLCLASGLLTAPNRTPEEQATYVAARATEQVLTQEKLNMCRTINTASPENGGFEVRFSRVTDGISETECVNFGYLLKPVINYSVAVDMLTGACNTVVEGDGFELRVTEVEIDRIKIPCVDILADYGLTADSMLATGEGVLIAPTITLPGMEFFYYSLHGNGGLVLDKDRYPTWVYNRTPMKYVDTTHVSLGDQIVETTMVPYLSVSLMAPGDCYPSMLIGEEYNFRALDGGYVLTYDAQNGAPHGFVLNPWLFEVIAIEGNDIVVDSSFTNIVTLHIDEVACRP